MGHFDPKLKTSAYLFFGLRTVQCLDLCLNLACALFSLCINHPWSCPRGLLVFKFLLSIHKPSGQVTWSNGSVVITVKKQTQIANWAQNIGPSPNSHIYTLMNCSPQAFYYSPLEAPNQVKYTLLYVPRNQLSVSYSRAQDKLGSLLVEQVQATHLIHHCTGSIRSVHFNYQFCTLWAQYQARLWMSTHVLVIFNPMVTPRLI